MLVGSLSTKGRGRPVGEWVALLLHLDSRKKMYTLAEIAEFASVSKPTALRFLQGLIDPDFRLKTGRQLEDMYATKDLKHIAQQYVGGKKYKPQK